MTKNQQDANIAREITLLRETLILIEESQRDGDVLRTVELAEAIEDRGEAIMWSAVANARQVPNKTWAEIGGRLRITRQAAQQRFSDLPAITSA
ncbi:MAG TPA: hypothetical protein VGM94_15545 [Galbitalea sp.]